MDRRTKEVIHDAIARQLSGVFPGIDLEIITEVVDAQVRLPVRPQHALLLLTAPLTTAAMYRFIAATGR